MSITTGPIIWASAGNIIYFPLFLIAVYFVLHRWHKVKKTVDVLAGKQRAVLLPAYSPWRERGKALFLCMSLLFLFLALLRPQMAAVDEKRDHQGRDLMIALDISRSMLATDCAPDRLSCAKKKIKDLVNSLDCERIGLILFSGSAFVQCPLTADRSAFFLFLDSIDVETISSGTTSIDQALREAIAVFKRMPERKNKLVILFTDGEDFSSNLAGIKQDAASLGVHVVTVGVGTVQGAPIPIYDENGIQSGHMRDDKNGVVISKINEGILQNLAQDCGGIYVQGSTDGSDIMAIRRYVTAFEREQLGERMFAAAQEKYQLCAVVSFIFLALAWVI